MNEIPRGDSDRVMTLLAIDRASNNLHPGSEYQLSELATHLADFLAENWIDPTCKRLLHHIGAKWGVRE